MGTMLDLQGWGSTVEEVAYELQPQLQVLPSCQCLTRPTSLQCRQLHPSHQKMSKSLIHRAISHHLILAVEILWLISDIYSVTLAPNTICGT